MSGDRTLTDADVDAIAERVQALTRPAVSLTLLKIDEVCELLRVSRDWVYAHKHHLGAVRLSDGPRGELRFPADRVRAHIEASKLAAPTVRTRRRPGRPAVPAGVPLLPIREDLAR